MAKRTEEENPEYGSESELNDFGFTFEDSTAVADAATTEHKKKLQKLESLILPLLNNLKKNPEKDTIFWPNREEKIQKQIDQILAITREN